MLTFQPSSDLGSDVYDTSEKQRIPAWTGEQFQEGSARNIEQVVRGNRSSAIQGERREYIDIACGLV